MVIHDADGQHKQHMTEMPERTTYLNFTIWGVLGFRKTSNHDDHGNTILVRQSDQDKALTYTYCRFELSSLLDDILIVDFDEFAYCPSVRSNVLVYQVY